jgi:hypothetical protein
MVSEVELVAMRSANESPELIKHGVCLGRAPGFRRKDVDMALQKALVSPE